MFRRKILVIQIAAILWCAAVCRIECAAQSRASHVKKRVALTSARVMSRAELAQIIDETVNEEAARYHIDPLLIYALMDQESSFNPRAVSPKGARGLMQLMPGTAARYGVRHPHDPRESIRAGAKYLVWLLDRYNGNVKLGLAGYNAGEGAVDKYGQKIPPYRETQDYVRLIEQRYIALARARKAGEGQAAGQTTGRNPAGTNEQPSTPDYSFRFRLPSSATAVAAKPADTETQSPAAKVESRRPTSSTPEQ